MLLRLLDSVLAPGVVCSSRIVRLMKSLSVADGGYGTVTGMWPRTLRTPANPRTICSFSAPSTLPRPPAHDRHICKAVDGEDPDLGRDLREPFVRHVLVGPLVPENGAAVFDQK